jgi:hypothetical protein
LGPHRQRAGLPSAAGAARSPLSAQSELAQALDTVRTAHFSADGESCDYIALANAPERERLAACLASTADFDPRVLRIPAQTAFWLNLYNACVLRDIPNLVRAGNVRTAERFFDGPRVAVAGHLWSLDDIEHGLLRSAPKYGRLLAPITQSDPRFALIPPAYDERVHFGMYSACRSSPPLRVFYDTRLDQQLEAAARDYIRRAVRVSAEGAVVVLPKLFQWYADDFGGRSGVLDFVLARMDDDTEIEKIDRRRGRVELQYSKYDWTLNAATRA